jgi:cytoskeletal protein RodZ
MSNLNDDNIFDEFEETPAGEPQQSPKKSSSSNKPFLVVLGIIGVLFLLAIIAFVVFATLISPQRNAARLQQAAEANAANTMTVMAATDQAFALAQTLVAPTSTSAVKDTLAPSPTFVVVFATETPTPTTGSVGGQTTGEPPKAAAAADLDSRTQTVAALLTQAAQGMPTQDPRTRTITALPTTGFADEVGLPGMLGIAVLLVGVIFLARRLRSAGN